jgi:TolB-like protein/DNA-binding winged helix-turn-helix (wHTH) protein/Tfp pilus assembly protein PilF
MASAGNSRDRIRTGLFEIDLEAGELYKSGRRVALQDQPFRVLTLLLQSPGDLVSRQNLQNQLWPADTYVGFDEGLNTAIRKLRTAFGDSADNPRFIETVPRRGYRFIAPTRTMESAVPILPDDIGRGLEPSKMTSNEVITRAAPGEAWRVSGRLGALLASLVVLLALVLVVFIIYGLRSHSGSQSADSQQRVMLAVLPFANLSNDPGQEYFSDGLTEETITDLGELNPERLGVIARTSAAAYKNTNKTIAQIGHELGVDYILEGSVRREGGSARITAQLIRVKDQAHLWAHNYDRETGGLLALQNELGRAIAQQVQVKLTTLYGVRSINKYAPNPEAYELYLKGRFYLRQRTFDAIEKSTEHFQRSIEKDPGFALAYAGLADSYLARATGSPQEFDPKAKEAASRALELDDDLAEAHAALGAEKADFEYDWPGAGREFKRAIELNANYADAHYRYAWTYLTPLGKSDQAIFEMKKALELDPFSRMDNTVLGCTYFYAREYDHALEQFKKAIELDPDFFIAHYHFAWLYSQLGQYQNAISELTKGRLLAGDDRFVKTAASEEVALRKALAAEGAAGFWKQLLRSNEKLVRNVGEFDTPQIYARLGDKERALKWLERSYEERETLGTLLNVDPAFDSLRSDQRFADLVRRMGLNSNAKGK